MNQRVIKFRAWDGEHMIHDIGIRSGMALHLDTGKMHDWPLMQHTGLNDKDGQEIYEGDITKDIEGGIGVVEFKATSFRAVDGLGWDNLAYPDECEVIGNIYQNPELLQQ